MYVGQRKQTGQGHVCGTTVQQESIAGHGKVTQSHAPGIKYYHQEAQTRAADCKYPRKIESRTFPMMLWVALVSTTLVM